VQIAQVLELAAVRVVVVLQVMIEAAAAVVAVERGEKYPLRLLRLAHQ
jgi:hypothetical protein